MYPLGSCTMKHNPRLNEKMARLPGFADIHPLQPASTVQGALTLMDQLAHWLKTLTGMPASGAHAQGRRPWRAVRHDGDPRRAGSRRRGPPQAWCWCPKVAHGTNPATAAFLGYTVDPFRPATTARRPRGHGQGRAGPDVAAHHADQPQHLRPVRDPTSSRSLRSRPRSVGGVLLLRWRQLQRHRRARCVRAISASTPCTSTCTRPSPRRMAAADRVPVRWCFPRRWRRSRRCLRQARAMASPRRAGRTRRRRGQAFGRITAFHGQMGMFVRALDLHAEPRRRRPAPGRQGRRAQRQLRHGPPRRT